MGQQDYTPQLMQAVAFVRAAYAVPEIKTVVDSFLFLSGTSAAFWLLSKAFGYLALGIHDALDESLAVLFAVTYNIVLAVLFATIIAYSVVMTGKGGGLFIWYKVAGFICVYVMLTVVYGDKSGKVDEYGLLGFLGGLISYIYLLLKPALLRHPVANQGYDIVYFVMQSGIARVLTAVAIVRGLFACARKIAQGILAAFRWLGGKLGRKAVASAAVFLV